MIPNHKLFLVKNAFYLAKSTSQSNGDLKGDLSREWGRGGQFGDRDSAIRDGFCRSKRHR